MLVLLATLTVGGLSIFPLEKFPKADMLPPVTNFWQFLAKWSNPQWLNYFLVYLK